ncbi:hypothetical protein [Mycolicibacterium tusciae]|jgi:hypothetical protein|uniref:Uncharacterized protein n=1 Tax=Mycolicibacterium tusciae TaxID=75922 RepID=A0A1X0JEW1_9MYCO|nr:hypothetical protein [Mycolicibacterium tusciae]ORB61190.1 hypothetical protein BST47_28935 [Mycolicibacterium tusciae]
MTLEERVARHTQMAEAYRDTYLRQGVKDGEAFAGTWRFAVDGVYASPYFTGDDVFKLSEFPSEKAFLDVAIGVHGPYRGTGEYLEALERRLAKSEVTA